MSSTSGVLSSWARELFGVAFVIGCGAALILLKQSALYCLGNCEGCINTEIFCGFMFSLTVLSIAVSLYVLSRILGASAYIWRKTHS